MSFDASRILLNYLKYDVMFYRIQIKMVMNSDVAICCHGVAMCCHGVAMYCHGVAMYCHGVAMYCHGVAMCCHGVAMYCHGSGAEGVVTQQQF